LLGFRELREGSGLGSITFPAYSDAVDGLDHGVGHSLLLLDDVKAPKGQKSNESNDLGHYLSNASLSTFQI
jgi:hypothetical protein